MAAIFEFSQIIGWRLRVVPKETVGRVFGTVRLFVLSGMIPGTLALSWISDHRSGQLAMIVGAFGFLAVTLFFIASPAVRNEAR